MLELLTPLFLGMGVGVLTGLLPGLHPNSVIFLLLPLYFRLDYPPMVFVGLATGMSTVHTFVSFIPSVFVGAPEGDTALSALPGHRFLLEGRGFEAVELTVYGGLTASAIALLSVPLLFHVVPPVYGFLSRYMHVVLLLLLGYLVLKEENRGWAVAVMALSGLLGLAALNSHLANTQYVLFPLFAGMFGLSVILTSIFDGMGSPPQGRSLPVRAKDTVRGGSLGFLAGLLAGFLPGIGSSQSALIVKEFGEMEREDFLVALGGVTTTDLFFSLVALYVIGNPRSGAAVAMQQVLPGVRIRTIMQVVGMCMVGVGLGALGTMRLARSASTIIQAVDYQKMLFGVTGFITAGSFLLTGWFGVLVLVTAAATGLLAAHSGVRRSNCMAALILPTVLHYSGLAFVI